MNAPVIAGLPPMAWLNPPVDWGWTPDGRLSITAGKETDSFVDPAGIVAKDTAPVALFTPPDSGSLFSARVRVGFTATYDAGVLQVRVTDDRWAKLCFEYSPQGVPMIVSVVTRGVSDDCNSVPIQGNEVFLRIACTSRAIAFHYSLDGLSWSLVRHFGMGSLAGARLGFCAQSPTGGGCTVEFSQVSCRAGVLKDIRSGE